MADHQGADREDVVRQRTYSPTEWLVGLTLLLAGLSLTVVVVADEAKLLDWFIQIAATTVAALLAVAGGIWLYTWQTEKNSANRKKELRAAQLIGIFDAWDLVHDEHLQDIDLPDGTQEKVLLTFLQTTIYDESIRSGLFGTAETLKLSRLSAAIQLYNGRAERLLPVLKSIGDNEDAPSKLVEKWRDEIHSVQDARQLVVTAGENLMKSWTFEEFGAALDASEPNSRDEVDPLVEKLVEEALPKITPAGYKAGLQEKLVRAQEAAAEGDHEAADRFLDEAIAEAQDMSGDVISAEDAQEFIETVHKAKKSLKDLSND